MFLDSKIHATARTIRGQREEIQGAGAYVRRGRLTDVP